MKAIVLYRLQLALSLPAIASGTVYLFPGAYQVPDLGALLVVQIGLLVTATLLHAASVLSPTNALVLCGWSVLVSWLAEVAGVHEGLVFQSRYTYAGFLGPQLSRGVPLVVPFVWFGLCYQALIYNQGIAVWIQGRAMGWAWQILIRALSCSYTLCIIDLLLDPVGTGVGAWVWEETGAYYTTPLGNFAGWLTVAMIIFVGYFLFERIHPPRPAVEDSGAFERLLGTLGLGLLLLPTALAVVLGRHLAAVLFALGMMPILSTWYRHAYRRPALDPAGG